MGHGSKILPDDTLVSDVMGERFESKWLMQLSLFPKKANEATGAAESTFEEVEWIPPPPEEAWNSEDEEQERKELKRPARRRSSRRRPRRRRRGGEGGARGGVAG